MSLIEVLVSSFVLTTIVFYSTSLYMKYLMTISKASTIDRRMAEIHSINENIRYQVSRWRISDDPYYLSYNITEEDCDGNMAQKLLDEMNIETPNRLEADGNLVISHNEGYPPAFIYPPQVGFCP